jgi:hypothetical protein
LNPRDPGAEHDEGLVFRVEVMSCTIRPFQEIGIVTGEPGTSPGIERTTPRARR